jgi:hypothetical protein
MIQHKVVRALIVAVLVAALWAGGRARAQTDPASPNRADTPGPLARLMQLSLNSVNRESAGALRATEVAARCAAETQQVRSYRSWLVKRDYSQAHLKESGFAYVEWNFDFVAPDRFHVRQTVRERPPLGNLADERISAGDAHYTNPRAWSKVGPDMAGDFAEQNRFLRPEKFLEILRTGRLNSMTVARADDGSGASDRYAVLEFENVRPGSYQILFEVEGMTARARIWVDAETGRLAKGELIFKGKNASNKQVELTFEQVFADYNSEITVQVPAAPAPRL